MTLSRIRLIVLAAEPALAIVLFAVMGLYFVAKAIGWDPLTNVAEFLLWAMLTVVLVMLIPFLIAVISIVIDAVRRTERML